MLLKAFNGINITNTERYNNMGLDISAYTRIKLTDLTEEDERAKHFTAYINRSFEGRCDTIKDRGVYSYQDSVHFGAGSYSGYNQWRNQLAIIAGWKSARQVWEAESGDFWELINFSDCEGIIDAQVCSKLLKDFEDYSQRYNFMDKYWKEKCAKWIQALRFASDQGAIVFH